MVLFRCLINVLIGPIYMETCCSFSNACSILELMLCNSNLTKLDILVLLSSDCRAWALKLSEHLKKQTYHVFSLHFKSSNKQNNLSAFSPKLFFLIFNILHLHKIYVMHTIFHILTNVIKVVKNLIFQKSLTSHETNWTLLFLSFSLAGPKTKAESPNSLQ